MFAWPLPNAIPCARYPDSRKTQHLLFLQRIQAALYKPGSVRTLFDARVCFEASEQFRWTALTA